MSIRYIGQDIHIPSSPGNFARGQTKVVRSTTMPDEGESKRNKANWYRDQLDRQVQQLRNRKQKEKQKEREEDERREQQFYKSLKSVQVNPLPNFHHQIKQPTGRSSSHQKPGPYSPSSPHGAPNPESDPSKNFKYYDFSSSRLAYIGQRKVRAESWNDLQEEEQALIDRKKDEEYSQNKISIRRKEFNEEIDRNLRDAFAAVDRSKIQTTVNLEEQLGKLRRKLKTQADQSSRYDQQPRYEDDRLYALPYRRAGALGYHHQHHHHPSCPNVHGEASRIHYFE